VDQKHSMAHKNLLGEKRLRICVASEISKHPVSHLVSRSAVSPGKGRRGKKLNNLTTQVARGETKIEGRLPPSHTIP